jgi:Ca-activated chloride channel family protein
MLELRVHPDAERLPTSPLNLCLVLDCSTSMQGERLDTIKATAIDLVRQIQPEDILSIIKFSDRAEVVVPAGSRADRRNIETRIQVLQAGGGTEILQGLDLGYAEVRRYSNPSHVNHIILITDGRTYGDEEACLKLANKPGYGIGISAWGLAANGTINSWMPWLSAPATANTSPVLKISAVSSWRKLAGWNTALPNRPPTPSRPPQAFSSAMRFACSPTPRLSKQILRSPWGQCRATPPTACC